MKKIMAAAAVASLLAGSAFAELSFSYTGKGIFGDKTSVVDNVARNDCFCLELANEIAGVHVDWDITAEGAKPALGLDEFYGWMTFGLPVGNLQITSGKWGARYIDRVTTDGGDLSGKYFNTFNPGNIISVTSGTTTTKAYSADADNLTEGEMASVLAYTLSDVLPGALLAKFGIVQNDNYLTGVVADPETKIHCGFVGELAYRQEKAFNFDLAIKHLTANQTSVGVYFNALAVENLQTLVGFTYGYNTADIKELAYDLRARYAITDKLALTGFFNFSQIKVENVDDPFNAMWTSLTVNYVAGENIRFLATLGNNVTNFDAEYGACITHFTPACEIKASEKATVTAAVDLNWDNSDASGVKPFGGTANITIPLYVTLSY